MTNEEKKEYVKLFAESMGAQKDVVPDEVQDALLTVLLAESGPEYALGGAVGALVASGYTVEEINEFVRMTASKVLEIDAKVKAAQC